MARKYYLYTDDSGKQWSMLQDEHNAAAAGNTLDDTHDGLPRRFRARVAHLENAAGDRRAIACGSPDSPIYAQNSSVVVNISGSPFHTTGRRGERYSVASNS
jgi:hypothetical protein